MVGFDATWVALFWSWTLFESVPFWHAMMNFCLWHCSLSDWIWWMCADTLAYSTREILAVFILFCWGYLYCLCGAAVENLLVGCLQEFEWIIFMGSWTNITFPYHIFIYGWLLYPHKVLLVKYQNSTLLP